ncbi:cholinephosphate cytidylyltransferase [Mycena amicta]|nr:cholinephosphate cytidylyltransferase [Mycena amicta]
MDASVLSDDDYDFVSASVSDLAAHAIVEPPPLAAAQDTFNTVQLSADDCMALASQSLGFDTTMQTKTKRIYVDGVFNNLTVRDVLQLRQIKLSFPSVYLVAGVFSDATCEEFGISVAPQVERCEVLRHCRWVDQVLPDAPCPIQVDFVANYDLVAVEEGVTVDPAYHKLRLKGYDDMKRRGIVLSTRKTTGTVSVPPSPSPRTPLPAAPETLAPDAAEPVDIYGIGC